MAERQPVAVQSILELLTIDASRGLDRERSPVHLDLPAHTLHVDHHASMNRNRAATDPGATAVWHDRDPALCAVRHDVRELLIVSRPDHAIRRKALHLAHQLSSNARNHQFRRQLSQN